MEIKSIGIPDRVKVGRGRERGREVLQKIVKEKTFKRTKKTPRKQKLHKLKIRDRKTVHANTDKNKLIFQSSK